MTSGEWLTDHPVLLAEWDSDRNPPLDPALFRAGSSRRVWWHCARGHHWQAVVSSRTRQGAGCPVCSGRRASATNNLAVVFPEVAATWDTPRNDGVGADHVAPRSSRRAAWRCAAGHEWTARVLDQIQHPDCQFCAGKKLTAANSLAALHPELAAQWHPTGNGALTPADVRPNTANRGVGWLCPHCGHSWRTSPRRRAIEGRNCPECAPAFPRRASNPITMTDPGLAAQWHPTRNGAATPDHITYGSHRLVWWQCPSGHEWESTPNHRKGHGCPYCTGRLPTPDRNLAVLHPELAAQWHPTRNGDVQPDQVLPASRRKLWWRCPHDHQWQATLQHRSRGQGCPYCAGRLPTPDRNLAVLHPELAAQWHPTRNGDRQPHQVTPASSQRVWWRCQRCGHDWQAKVNTRSFGTGCPACAATRR